MDGVTVYTCTDGESFIDKDAAVRHEYLIEKRSAYNEARRGYTDALTGTNKTADGMSFAIKGYRTYYFVSAPFYSIPKITELSFYFHHCDFDEQDDTIIKSKQGDHWISYKITELYYFERSAKIALAKKTNEWACVQRERADDMIEKLGIEES